MPRSGDGTRLTCPRREHGYPGLWMNEARMEYEHMTIRPTATWEMPRALVEAAITLLTEHGPSALQSKRVAAACGASTMVIYTHFGGMKQLIAAVAAEGHRRFAEQLHTIGVSDDPVADLMIAGRLRYRFAAANPHLQDLMAGIAGPPETVPPVRNWLDPDADPEVPEPQDATWLHLVDAATRAIDAGRFRPADPRGVAAEFWSSQRGFLQLLRAGHFGPAEHAEQSVLIPMGFHLLLGLGDTLERIEESRRRSDERLGEHIPTD
ncbi:TetR/AcrR family transcriptional regulator [Pseudonocardiaceae bacterium YIM PH 21723]|nr:TetR/AcrR family transcriptional regulator [Pseudonocardiaceae bacterium YIM PH 21723]